jgi:hypothetical protein
MDTLCARASVTASVTAHTPTTIVCLKTSMKSFQMVYAKLLTQKEYLNDHKFRLIIVPELPDTPLYTNHALYAILTRHGATDTSEDCDSDVSHKGLRGILAQFHASSDDEASDARPKYSSLTGVNTILPTVNLTAKPKNTHKTTKMILMLKLFLKPPLSLGGA